MVRRVPANRLVLDIHDLVVGIKQLDAMAVRVELFNTHYQIMDIENEPVGWDPADHNIAHPWGLPARQSWFEEATPFAEVAIREPQVKPSPMTLEKYLAKQNA